MIDPFNTSTCQSLSSLFFCSGWTNLEKDAQVSYLLHLSFFTNIWIGDTMLEWKTVDRVDSSRGKHPQVKTQESTASRDLPITFALLCYVLSIFL